MSPKDKIILISILPNFPNEVGIWYYGAFGNQNYVGKLLYVKDSGDKDFYYAKIPGNRTLKPIFKSHCSVIEAQFPRGGVVKDNT